MKLLVTLEMRFSRTRDGQVWTRTTYGYPYWKRYLNVFDGVKVVARAERKDTVDDEFRPVCGPGVEFVEVPYYCGPRQYVQVRRRVRETLMAAVRNQDALICRVASHLAMDLLPVLWDSGRPYGLEVVADPHEVFAPGATQHALRSLFRYLFTRALEQQCLRAAAVSYVTERALQRRYPARENGFAIAVSDAELPPVSFSDVPRVFTTYYSSTDLSLDDYVAEPKEFALPVRPRLVFVGTLAQLYKGQDVLLRAVALLKERQLPVELRIIGEGKHRLELESLSRALSLDGVVSFVGELPAGAAVRAELDNATVLVLPSRTEGLPRVIVEAMARGLPCVATSVGGIPELLHPDDLVPSNDHQALANKIQSVICDPSRLNQMSERNLEKAQEFRPDCLENRRTEFYQFLKTVTAAWMSHGKHKSYPVFAPQNCKGT